MEQMAGRCVDRQPFEFCNCFIVDHFGPCWLWKSPRSGGHKRDSGYRFDCASLSPLRANPVKSAAGTASPSRRRLQYHE
jgi:hypothetical protein